MDTVGGTILLLLEYISKAGNLGPKDFYPSNMGQFIVKNRVNIIYMTPQTELEHLCPSGKIFCRKENDFDVLLLEIKLDRCCTSKVCLWPTFENSQRSNIFKTWSPTVSYASSSDSDSRIEN